LVFIRIPQYCHLLSVNIRGVSIGARTRYNTAQISFTHRPGCESRSSLLCFDDVLGNSKFLFFCAHVLAGWGSSHTYLTLFVPFGPKLRVPMATIKTILCYEVSLQLAISLECLITMLVPDLFSVASCLHTFKTRRRTLPRSNHWTL
jgi:hypothetical protein